MTDIVGGETLRSLWTDLSKESGEHVFLIFQGRHGERATYTYRSFDEEINRSANLFLSLGVQHGDRVAVQMHACPEFMMCLFGLAKIGAVMVPVNEQYHAEEAAFVLERTAATCAVVEPAFAETYRTLAADSRFELKTVLVARVCNEQSRDGHQGGRCKESHDGFAGGIAKDVDFACLRSSEPAVLREERHLSSEDPVEILFTSGTTSRPKGVVLTHANLLFSGLYGDWEVMLTRDDRLLSTMPACHSNFQLAALTPVLTAGATLVLIEKYSASRFWRQVREYKATVAQCVSMMLRTLLLQPEDPFEQNHCLREMLYFLPVSHEEKRAFEERYGVTLMNTYGSTESVCWVLTDLPVGSRNWPSVGRPGLGYEVRIARDDGSVAVPGELGEIQVKGTRGRTMMKEYFGDPGATSEAFTEDGWLKTGDKGYQDERGWFFFVDRKTNMIKRSGENVSASEVESILLTHPAVDEAAVIGVPDAIRDQAIKAFVKPKCGHRLTKEAVLEFCAEHMAGFKVPSYVEIVDDFPRTCSMKIEKKLLK